MKLILTYFKDFQKEYYTKKFIVALLIIGCGLLAFNYTFDFEDSYIDKYARTIYHTIGFFIYHYSAYILVLIGVHFTTNRKVLDQSKSFWVKLTLAMLILAISRSFYYHIYIADLFDGVTKLYISRVMTKFRKLSLIFLLVGGVYWLFDRNKGLHFYGLDFKAKNLKIYVILLACMVPIIAGASFLDGFQKFYPFYKKSGGALMAQLYHLPEWIFVTIYETVYASEFISVELFFRGFLILGFTKYLGKDVVIPMAFTYAVYHFGKPMGEAISSIFGGYILGVISYYSKNLWGGVFLHVGIALLMELFAYLQM
ncbi:CPBP family intramembrane glutamic endopeptidase [Flammeovirga kamogawensis]|uniref:CPBP family intramembrane metalloprotease n=1 Tax=Flammeovirga kamogawensis TaxID=373891 RepID=A0ABX8H2J2_9BACT|nr:CPBP family intramembrane glutamic endopeptidase [Flammeovirga kamogawensis]MBB6463617.1 hypothetical protein [Flammeovirga kamogawensis]QWG09839.1 CPBP family intramembrane metalloprotease [Flammeovirga kamogawensis]TRX65346.1 CPBP family intramembrane metalloprotease [Flammeovirga kamogawensis]